MRIVCAGAAGGIGRRAVSRFLDAGHEVVALDRDADGLDSLRESVDHTEALEATVVDLTNEEHAAAAVEGVAADAVVSCVGWYSLGAVEDCSPERLREHLEANLVAVHAVVQPLLSTLRARSGRVVIVGSMAGSVPLPFHGGYSAAKAGLAAYATTLRRELRAHDVDVVLIEPGPTRTGFNERAATALREAIGTNDGDREPRRPDGSPYTDVYRAFESYAPESVPPETVTTRVVTATTTRRPRARYRVGARARWLPRVGAILPTGAFDRLVRSGMPDGRLGRWIDRRR
ncbi:SDR family NAD(P)-dependent oxidoreductase [Halorubrum vacuolatum]|uniref:Short-chain dehydrogenase n=1 Tax=Halorubrum vacuolatum TaxID=63740 RepID=A0A238XKL7_HALVU|nr:SDR family NAD(P)-dependent oxidoreductase [Halorubrum vacuolatum]SNR59111.1 Short-chain dehydrogenase [Halorubrum vacuolatum]